MHEIFVDLVAENPEIVLPRGGAKGFHLPPAGDLSAGIVGRVDDDGLCPWGELPFQVGSGQPEHVAGVRPDRHGRAAKKRNQRDVTHPRRFKDQDLVTGIDNSHEHDVQREFSAGRADDFRVRVVVQIVVPLEFDHNGLTRFMNFPAVDVVGHSFDDPHLVLQLMRSRDQWAIVPFSVARFFQDSGPYRIPQLAPSPPRQGLPRADPQASQGQDGGIARAVVEAPSPS